MRISILLFLAPLALAAPLAPNDQIIRSFGTAPLRHPASILHLAASADGRRIATLAADSQLRLWDADTGKLIAARQQATQVAQILLSPDGATILVNEHSKGMTAYSGDDLADAKPIVKSGPNANVFFGIQCVALSPDGTRLARPKLDRGISLEIVDLKQNKSLRTIPTQTGIPQSLAFRDDQSLVMLAPDGNLQFYAADGKHLGALRIPRPNNAIGHGAFLLAGGRHVIFLDEKQRLHMAEVTTHDKDLVPVRLLDNKSIGILYPPSSSRFLLCGDPQGQQVSLVDVIERKDLSEHIQTTGNARQFAANLVFSADGKRMFVGRGLNTVRVTDTSTWQGAVPVFGHTGVILRLALSPDGAQLISASADGSLRIWDRATGQQLQAIEGIAPTAGAFDQLSNGDLLSIAANARTLFRPGKDTVRKSTLDLSKSKLARPPMAAAAPRADLAAVFLPTSTTATTLTFLDLKTDQPRRSLELRSKSALTRVHLSGSSKGLLAMGAATLALYDLSPTATTQPTALEPLYTTTLPASADTTPPAFVGGWDFLLVPQSARAGQGNQPEARLVEAYSALEMLRLETAPAKPEEGVKANRPNPAIFQLGVEASQYSGQAMTAVAASPDLRLFVTANPLDRRLRFWDALSGRLLHATAPAPSAVSLITFSSDGTALFTGGNDGSLNEWKLPPNLLPDLTPATTEQLAQAVRALSSAKPAEAYAAVQLLSRSGDTAVSLLKDTVAPPRLDQAEYDRLIRALDADTFKERRRAADDLVTLGPIAVAALRSTAAQTPSDEAYNSIQGILTRIQKGEKTAPALLSRLRAAHILQRIATPAAKQALTAAAQPDQPPVVLFRVHLALESLP